MACKAVNKKIFYVKNFNKRVGHKAQHQAQHHPQKNINKLFHLFKFK